MSAREGAPVVDFFSAESGGRGEIVGRESSAFQPPVKPSPPVALSLRTRESSALAVKHIFDQIYFSADSKSNNNSSGNRAHEKRDVGELHSLSRDASNAAFQGARNPVSPSGWQANSILEEYKVSRTDMDSSFAKVQPQVFATNNSNFGTPPLVQSSNRPCFQTGIPQAVSRPIASSPSLKQPAAQLTIFYSGTVNVYDDIPADRANAIMLLAGTGNPCATKSANNEGEKEQASVKLSSLSPPVRVIAPPLTADATASSVSTPSATPLPGKTMGFNLPSAPNMTPNTVANTVLTPSTPPSAGALSATPLPGKTMGFNLHSAPNMTPNTVANTVLTPTTIPSAASMPTEPKPQAAPPKRSHAGIELPQARKASLARFLEKRKDRAQVKQQEQEASAQGEGKGGRDESLTGPKKPCITGLTSPTFRQ